MFRGEEIQRVGEGRARASIFVGYSAEVVWGRVIGVARAQAVVGRGAIGGVSGLGAGLDAVWHSVAVAIRSRWSTYVTIGGERGGRCGDTVGWCARQVSLIR